jgi:hypothetical protein
MVELRLRACDPFHNGDVLVVTLLLLPSQQLIKHYLSVALILSDMIKDYQAVALILVEMKQVCLPFDEFPMIAQSIQDMLEPSFEIFPYRAKDLAPHCT